MKIPETLLEIGFGKRSLNFSDFEIACRKERMFYIETDEKLLEEGLSYPRTRGGRRFRVIVLRRTLFRENLTEVAWHEFAHAYYEHYGVRCFVRGSEDKLERQADDLALCCLIPTIWVETRTFNELLDEGFTSEQLYRRRDIHEACGI